MKRSLTSILKAVQAFYEQSDPLQAALPGGLWTGEIPEGDGGQRRALPCGLLENGRTSYEWTTEGSFIEESTFTVTLFAESVEALDDALDLFESALEFADLGFAGGDSVVDVYPTDGGLAGDPLRDSAGNPVYSGWINYAAKVFRV